LALPPSGTTDQAFLREVDEAYRADQAMNIWKRHGRWIIVGVVVVLVAVAGVLFARTLSARAAGKQGEQFDAVLKQFDQGKGAQAAGDVDKLATGGNPGFRALARMVQANALIDQKNIKGAADKFGEIAGDASAPKPFRDEAKFRQTAVQFDSLKPEQVISQLQELAVPDSPWFGPAGELVAISYLKQGKRDAAGKLFGQIAQSKTQMPETVRARAVQMAGVLGVDAIDQSGDVKAQ
jgi:hypothetical protein